MTENLLNTKQAATRLGIYPQTVISLAERGALKGSFFARTWKFRNEDLDAFVQSTRRSSK